jgi:hypothetical protein
MGELLNLCATHHVQLPLLTATAVEAATHVMLKSPLPVARVQAAHALAAAKDKAAVRSLFLDSSKAVAAVAQHYMLEWGELPKEAGGPPPKRQHSKDAPARPPPARRTSSSRSREADMGSDTFEDGMVGDLSDGEGDDDDDGDDGIAGAFEQMSP